jgi:hypothetical protein
MVTSLSRSSACWLLRARRERLRSRRAAEQRDEFAPPHVEHGASLRCAP